MSQQGAQEITVFFDKHNWTNIKRILESFLDKEEQASQSEWKFVVQDIETVVSTQSSEHLRIGISFLPERLEEIKQIIVDACERTGDSSWSSWGESIAHRIEETIENPQAIRAEEEAWNLFEEAAQLMDNADRRMYDDAASFLLMAIDKASWPFQEAHSLLSVVALGLGKEELAKEQADLALKYQPEDFLAQSVKVRVAANQLKFFNLSGLTKTDGSLLDIAIGGFALFNTSRSQKHFEEEVQNWINIFTSQVSSSGSIRVFVTQAYEIIELADRVVQVPELKSIAAMMYVAVSNVNLNDLSYEDSQVLRQAERIQVLAQGRTRL